MEKEIKKDEVTNNFIFMGGKGCKKMKISLADCIKLGFGFYIGYNIARALKYSLIKKEK